MNPPEPSVVTIGIFSLKTERKNVMKIMKRVGKQLGAAAIIFGMFALAQNVKAEAAGAKHEPGCSARLTIVKCVNPMSQTGEAHTYYSAETGMAYCSVTIYHGTHNIYCANCMVKLSTQDRVCSKTHKNCGAVPETGLCQY